MAMEVFVGNLPLDTTAHDLRALVGHTEQPVYFRVVRKRARNGELICYGVGAPGTGRSAAAASAAAPDPARAGPLRRRAGLR